MRIRLEDRADKKQISKLDYAVGHNSTIRTPGTHFVWLRKPLDRDLSHYNYDVGKGDIEGATFVEHCHNLAGNFMILWLYENYLRYEPNANIETKYNTVRQALQTKIQKVFCLENFEDSWNQVADILKIDREPRLNTNRSDQDYKKYANRNQLSQEFIDWHKKYNRYDYQLYNEFCA